MPVKIAGARDIAIAAHGDNCRNHAQIALDVAYTEADKAAAAAGISLQDLDPDSAQDAAAFIGRDFGVSGEVIRKRLRFDGICHWAKTNQ